ncbi:MAG: cysteine--tRNA ligase [Actinomycetota bacterium]
MLKLKNTLSRAIEEVQPITPGRVQMYSCGPTVYKPVQIGNLRSFLLSDIIARVLRYHGLEVRRLMNITDVGHMTDELTDSGRDKMLLAADDEGLTSAEIAQKYTDAFRSDSDAIGIARADAYPKATDHIPQIIELVAKLIERGHAYERDGTVYFDVTSFPSYGSLSNQDLDAMRAAHRIEVDPHKRNHQDFVLWVAAGPRRELVFDSPWGSGYPGWHIECSAMSLHHLGDRFEIHTGGVDNRFPHHEDEIAQSDAAVGHRVVDIWVHGEHLLMSGARMAKSVGNVVTISDLVERGFDPLAFRYLCFTGRYRRQVDFTEEALDAAQTTLRRLRERIATLGPKATETGETAASYEQRFVAALDDDLDLPSAVTLLHALLSDPSVPPAERVMLAARWDDVLALNLVASTDVGDEVEALVAERESARSAGNYARADEIRDQLRRDGIELLDSPEGTHWVRR